MTKPAASLKPAAARARPTAAGQASARAPVLRPAPVAKPQVTTIRLDQGVQNGLRLLEAHSGVKRPLNKWVNLALAELIDRQAAALEDELGQALRNVQAYRQSDPGFKRAIQAVIDAELEHAAEDPMEGQGAAAMSGPAVAMVRGILRG